MQLQKLLNFLILFPPKQLENHRIMCHFLSKQHAPQIATTDEIKRKCVRIVWEMSKRSSIRILFNVDASEIIQSSHFWYHKLSFRVDNLLAHTVFLPYQIGNSVLSHLKLKTVCHFQEKMTLKVQTYLEGDGQGL